MFANKKSKRISLPKSESSVPYWKVGQWLLPVLLAFVIYIPILANGFTFDDFQTVINNECIDGTLSLSEALSRDVWCMTGDKSTGSWRPLTVLLLRTTYNFFPDQASAFHLISLLLYLLLVALAISLSYKLTYNLNITVFSALLFAAHPVHTEAVASISAISDLLSAVFVFSSLIIYAGLLRNPEEWRRRWVAIPLLFVGLLAKENAATAFGLIFLFDVALKFQGPKTKIFFKNKSIGKGKTWVPWALALATWIFYLSVKQSIFGQLIPRIHFSDNILADLSGVEYYATAFSAIFEYLRLLVFPLSLSVDYSFNQIPLATSLFRADVILVIITMVTSIVTGFILLRKNFTLAFSLLMIWTTLSISSNLVVLIPTMVAERLLLVPSFGICLIGGILLEKLRPNESQGLRLLFSVSLIVLFILLSFKTVDRNMEWYSNSTIFVAAAKETPNSRKVQINTAWFSRGNNNWPRALLHYKKAEAIKSAESDSFLAREIGLCHHALGDFEQALKYYQMALKAKPDDEISKTLKQRALLKEVPPNLNEVPRSL